MAQRVKNPPAMWGDLGLVPGLGRSPGEGNSYPLQYSRLENSMDCIVHRVAESDTIEPLSLSGTRVEEGRREANTRCHVIQLITASKPSLFLRETISRYCILQQPKDSSGEEIFVCKLFLICHLILVQICPMAHATLELLRYVTWSL